MEMGVNAMSMFAGTQSNDLDEGRVIQLLNMVTAEELIDNEEYEGMHSPTLHSFPSHLLRSVLSERDLTWRNRNLRRHPRRMHQIRPNPRNEDPTTGGWVQAIKRRGKDLHQVC